MAELNRSDLDFILQQILTAEAHAAGTALINLIGDPLLPDGLRTVDGKDNNLLPGNSTLGSADLLFPRMLTPSFVNDADGDSFDANGPAPGGLVTNNDYGDTANGGNVADADPRIISNLIADQTANNSAAASAGTIPGASLVASPGRDGVFGTADDTQVWEIPNVAPDGGLSAPFNSWMTLFGQFFDHGLDLASKGGSGTIFIPLQPDDPLYNPATPSKNFMVVTRLTNQPGADGILGTADDIQEHQNTTTPFVDQNQTYTSHASHQAFLREYVLDTTGAGSPVATGRLLEGANGGLATWDDIKAQAANILGIQLSDFDVNDVPLLATDQYGRLLLSANGQAQMVTTGNVLVEGNRGNPISTANAVHTGHAFLNDIAHHAAPGEVDHDHDPNTPKIRQAADTDAGPEGLFGDDGDALTYDNELLGKHYITGDGRGNENIGLTAVHHVFHSEHNRQVDQIKTKVIASGDQTFIDAWHLPSGEWDGERLFQAARFATEMQYQHLVFEEFGRKIMPTINAFGGYQADIDPSITAEFAHTVYRFGHSMLNETVDRLDANGNIVDQFNNAVENGQQMGLIRAFLNPLAYAERETDEGIAAGEIVRGMTRQVGNEIDEFVTDALRNNLVGLPLDLAAINIARGRDAGIPSLNAARRQFFDATGDSQLTPYTSWSDFANHLKHPASVINFIAAYGTHSSIVNATTLDAKRDAAMLLVLGNTDVNGDGIPEVAPSDRLQFLNSTGAWASGSNGITTTGLDTVDFWIGGLAEKLMPFGGMLGSTFGFVFETQMEHLQDGDRLYYLSRTAGLNFLAELEGNTFAQIIALNTDARHLPGDVFSTPDFVLELNAAAQFGADPAGLVLRNNPVTPGPDANYLRFSGEQHVVLGGTDGADILIAGVGDDTIWGDAGNDRLEGGAGNDFLMGGAGDDIIVDSFGDDNLKGEAGNDVINAGAGIDLIIGGDGNDFVVAGADLKETLAGQGDDFVRGSNDADAVVGGEGNDWIEGGDGADDLTGDNGVPLLVSNIIGNDVMIGGGNDDGFVGESGDDIFVGSLGQERYEGMFGFDWVTHKGDTQPGQSDMLITIFTDPLLAGVRDRFRDVEGLSGWNGNDLLRGDNTTTIDLTAVPAGSTQNNALNNSAQIAVINGLQGLLDGMFGDADLETEGFQSQTSFSGGNIILGGDGDDTIEGRGGNDLMDGDKWLNTRLTWVDANNVQRYADSMSEIQAQMFAGTLNPGQLRISRDIVTANGTGDVDVAVYSQTELSYSIINNDDLGTWTIVDLEPLTNGFPNPLNVPVLDEGSDTLRNIEVLRFSDGAGGFTDISLDPFAANVAAEGAVTISDPTPDEDQVLTVTGEFTDFNGSVNRATIRYAWQAETSAGEWTTVLEDSTTFTPTNAQAGQALRVVATFEDNLGNLEMVISDATDAVINNNDTPSGTDGEVTINEDTSLVFTTAHFGFVDPDLGDALNEVQIDALPTAGSLTLRGVAVEVGQKVSAAEIDAGDLVFTPVANQNGEAYANVGFRVSDQSGAFDQTLNTLWVNVLAVNSAPEGTDKTITILEDNSHTFVVADFGFTDLDAGNGDALRAVRVDSVPTSGRLTFQGLDVVAGQVIQAPGIASGLLKFAPSPNENGDGYASFTFSVQDLASDFDADPNTMTLDVTPVNDLPAGIPTISDVTPTEGDTLTTDVAAIADNDGLGEFSYQWQAFSGGNWNNIAGAIGDTFTPLQAQVNSPLRARITYTDGGGTTEIVFSAATTVVGDLFVGTSAADVRTFTNGEDSASGLGGNDVFSALAGNDLLDGGAGNDSLLGGADNDVLIGGDGNDTLDGGVGADDMTGGLGDDTYFVDDAGDVVTELAAQGADTIRAAFNTFSLAALGNIEHLTFIGNGNFVGTGNAAVNKITGGDGNDRIDGAAGNDTMVGGLGDDTYVVSAQTDIITELADQGIDTVESGVTFSLSGSGFANVENITLMGSGSLNATGNALNNVLIGTASNNRMAGDSGNDMIFAGFGADLLHGGSGDDVMEGGDGADVLDLSAAAATTITAAIAAGADRMSGGRGDDTYGVDNAGDVVVEFAGEGTDTIRTSLAAFDLGINGANVENLVFLTSTRTDAITAVGNSLANSITTANGNDTITGGAGNDSVTSNGGDDRFIATAGDGNDTFTGGANTTSTNGRTGGDTYDASATGTTSAITVSISGLNLLVAGGEIGSDTLNGVENIIGSKLGDTVATGSSVNRLDGHEGNDSLNAGSGNDTLIGGVGNDTLIGGSGNDIFIFATAFGHDLITGSIATDRFDADNNSNSTPGGAQDMLDISALGITAIDFGARVQIDSSSIPSATLITIDGNDTIQLDGVTGIGNNAITISDFFLA